MTRRGQRCNAEQLPESDPIPGLTDRPPAIVVVVASAAALGLAFLLPGVLRWPTPPVATHLLASQPPSHLAEALLGLLLVVLAKGVAGRRVVAHRLLAAVLAVAALGAAFGAGHSLRHAALLGVLLAGLLLVHDHFRTQPDPGRVRAVAAAAGVTAGISVVLAGIWLLWRTPPLRSWAGVGVALRAAVAGLIGSTATVHTLVPDAADLATVLVLVGGVTALAGTVVLLAPRTAPGPAPADVRSRVAELVRLPGNDTLAPFVLRHDKDYLFSPDGRAAVGYRVVLGVAVVGGDPVGAPDALGAAIRAFLEHCARQGWRPLVIGARVDRTGLWTVHGLRAVGIGDEVVIDIGAFTLDTPRLRNVRQAVKRTRNAGVTVELQREAALGEQVRAELAAVTARCWDGRPERGFSMNLDGLLAGLHPEALFVICRDRRGRVVAFQRYAVCVGGAALSLDTMCRAPDAPNGVNERMIVEGIEWGRDHGAAVASLNFAAFRSVFETAGRGPAVALGNRAIHLLDRWIKVESLYRFNAKFRPRWLPRSVVLRSWADLPVVLPAALSVEFGGPLDVHRPAVPATASGAAERDAWVQQGA